MNKLHHWVKTDGYKLHKKEGKSRFSLTYFIYSTISCNDNSPNSI
jgi:hypothetical protein